MKILLLTGKMENGGAETHVHELASGLVKRGHDVTLVSSGGRYADALCHKGVRCLTLPTCKKTPLSLLSLFWGLQRLISKESFDVVHSHTRIASSVASLVCRRKAVPLLTTAHARFSYRGWMRGFSRWGDATIAVSQDIGQHLLNSKMVSAENITVIANGVDTHALTPSQRAFQKKICFLSRLDSDCSDAALLLCRISKSLASKFEDIDIYIGGDGEELWRVREMAESANRNIGRTAVHTVGRVTDVAEFLSGASVFVGVSRAALEAMSCGVPVVLAGNEGYLGAVDDDVILRARSTNFCCRGEGALDDESLERDILGILNMTDDRRRELSEVLRDYVEKHHSSCEMVRRTEEVYNKVIRPAYGTECGVLLCGYYGFDNMGDDALLHAAIVRARKEYPNMPICALTKNGHKDSRRFGVRCVCRHTPMAAREIRRAAVVVFGGGTLLQNSTSRRSLMYYLRLLTLAQRANASTVLWGNGIGNIRGAHFQKMTARALSKCAYVGLRDRESADEAVRLFRRFGYTAPSMALEEDLASNTKPCSEQRLSYILSALGIDDGTPIAVIAIRGVEGSGYRHIMEKHIGNIVSEGVTPVFLPMFPIEDLEACRNVCNDRGGVIAYPVGISDAVALIRYATVVLAMRYHACVFAASVGTPFVGYGAEPKIERFCRSHGGKYFTEIV